MCQSRNHFNPFLSLFALGFHIILIFFYALVGLKPQISKWCCLNCKCDALQSIWRNKGYLFWLLTDHSDGKHSNWWELRMFEFSVSVWHIKWVTGYLKMYKWTASAPEGAQTASVFRQACDHTRWFVTCTWITYIFTFQSFLSLHLLSPSHTWSVLAHSFLPWEVWRCDLLCDHCPP